MEMGIGAVWRLAWLSKWTPIVRAFHTAVPPGACGAKLVRERDKRKPTGREMAEKEPNGGSLVRAPCCMSHCEKPFQSQLSAVDGLYWPPRARFDEACAPGLVAHQRGQVRAQTPGVTTQGFFRSNLQERKKTDLIGTS